MAQNVRLTFPKGWGPLVEISIFDRFWAHLAWLAVDGLWRLAVGGSWQLIAVGDCRLAVGGCQVGNGGIHVWGGSDGSFGAILGVC